tara:strand:+ start:793 stop:906 length:114 start_codon:yes stop_codon:yes gene_type:complete
MLKTYILRNKFEWKENKAAKKYRSILPLKIAVKINQK